MTMTNEIILYFSFMVFAVLAVLFFEGFDDL